MPPYGGPMTGAGRTGSEGGPPRPRRRRPLAARALVAVAVLASLGFAAMAGWMLRAATLEPLDDQRRQQQLAFLDRALDSGAAEQSQRIFPEGFVFQHALTGLAHATPALPGDQRALAAARTALRAVDSPAGTERFGVADPPSGAFHAGWSLLLAVQVSRLSGQAADAGAVQARSRRALDSVRNRLDRDGSPFLDSYPGQSWPVDTVVLVAALAQADAEVGVEGASSVVDRWRSAASELADPTGLLAHRTRADGTALDGARGSSQALIQTFWPDIDPLGAADSYSAFLAQFADRCAGLVGIREYPLGRRGSGDVDSGPLVDGCSASATAVTLAAAVRAGDLPFAATLDRQAELAWTPTRTDGRRYAGGLLPVADAFLAWARAQPVGPGPQRDTPHVAWGWWVGLPAATSVLCGVLAVLAVRRLRRSGPLREGVDA